MNAGANGSLVCMADSSRSITPLEPVKKLLRIHIEFIGTAVPKSRFPSGMTRKKSNGNSKS
jgi:hypothetical protein